MKLKMTLVALSICALTQLYGQTTYSLSSPDGNLKLSVRNGEKLEYALDLKGSRIMDYSPIAMTVDNAVWGQNDEIIGTQRSEVSEKVYPVHGSNRELNNEYNELSLKFKGGYSVVFRLFDQGSAYRICADGLPADSIKVVNETAVFNLCDDPSVIIPETNNFTAWELSNKHYDHVSEIQENKYGITPVIFTNKDKKVRVVVAESDVNVYPGMYLRKEEGAMKGFWAAYPKEIVMGSWGNFITVVKEREDYLTVTGGDHAFPWRIVIVAEDDRDLLANEMVYLLAKPQQIKDTDWIKPGKAVWEWWSCAILENADFPNGHRNLSTQLYKYYIDFAAENNIPYLLVDAGWSNVFDHSKLNPRIDIAEVIRYGKEKGVGVWLWTVAATLFHNPHIYLDYISSLGAVGVKIDFFDRDDAEIMPQYEALAKACAERRLMVDYHGCSKPTGLHRAYPNILSYEAMRCAECFKWDTTSNPDYQLECIFARMLGGGIDYTPGSMRNSYLENFKPVDPGLPTSLGTKAHELALFVVLTAPFSSLCDSPDEYRKYPDIMKFLGEVPTTWDKTIPLAAEMGEYAVMARQKDGAWFVGGLNSWGERKVEVDFSFLEAGKKYEVEILMDGRKTKDDPNLYEHKTVTVTSSKKMDMNMASGGGFVMTIKEK